MSFHPHLHCILSAGGWHDTKQTWIKAKKLNSGFFIPQKVLATCFKKHFLVAFSQIWEQDKLLLPKDLMQLNNPDEFRQFYNQIAFKKNWIVKIMPPLDNPKRVIDYLGRYVYRIAITDSRIKEVKIKERQVLFEYKDYAAQTDPSQLPPFKTLTLDALEFIRRFVQHVLPKGFQKTRYFGIYATAYRTKLLPQICKSINQSHWHTALRSVCQIIMAATGLNPDVCPCCASVNLIAKTILPQKSNFIRALNIQITPVSRPPPHNP
jgi:Putative transposase